MHRYSWTIVLLLFAAVVAGCTRTTEEVIVDRHRVDTEFVVE